MPSARDAVQRREDKSDAGDLASTVAAAKEKKLKELNDSVSRQRCKKAAKVAGHIVILIVVNAVVLYAGAFLFLKLESYNEIENCYKAHKDYKKALNTTRSLMMLAAGDLQSTGAVTAEGMVKLEDVYKVYLRNFSIEVFTIGHNSTHDCSNLGNNAKWTISSSIIFALTVITTIGYGVISPATEFGKLICMVYAVVGIPIYLVALANIGEVLAKAFKKGYWLACCCGCFRKKPKKITMLTDKRGLDGGGSLASTSSLSDAREEVLVGIQAGDEEDETTIPLTITIAVLAFSVLIGGLMFHGLDDMTFENAMYFSFVTISTLGFGDLVPSFDLSSGQHGLPKLLLMVMYITVGMAAISMCFQLMSDEIRAKFSWLLSKCDKKSESSSTNDDDNDTEQPKGIPKQGSFRKQMTSVSMNKMGLSRSRTLTNIRVKKNDPSPSTSRRKM